MIPSGQLPVFADQGEYEPLVDLMQMQFGARTAMGRALVESLALDLLRLRHIRAMEISVFDPGPESDYALEQALQTRERASRHRSDRENADLLEAYGAAAAQVRAGGRISISDDVIPAMTTEIWSDMTNARESLERNKQELQEMDAQIVAADPEEVESLRGVREMILDSIVQDENGMRMYDQDLYLIEKESQITPFLLGRKRLPPGMVDRWAELLERRRSILLDFLREVRNADVGIHRFRRRHLLDSVQRLDELNRLAEYEDRVRRSIAKTVTLIKEIERDAGTNGGAVIDIEAE